MAVRLVASIVAFVGLLLFVVFALVFGVDLGLGQSRQVSGDIVGFARAGQPVVTYAVDGSTYQHAVNQRSTGFVVGQQLTMCYAPDSPAQAQPCSARTVSIVTSWALMALVAVGSGMLLWTVVRQRRRLSVLQTGSCVMATITGTRANPKVRHGPRIVWTISCLWTDPTGRHELSKSIWSTVDPGPVLTAARVTALPVYVDPKNPGKRYVVDGRQVIGLLNGPQFPR